MTPADRSRRPTRAVSSRPPIAHRFTLVAAPAAGTVSAEAAGPGIPFELAPLAAADADIATTILLIAGGMLLIALMCADAAGSGPRHAYLRRRAGSWRLPWR
jgi:hypothetical protein